MTLFQNNCPAATFRSSQVVLCSRLDGSDVFCLEAFGPLDDVKLDRLAFLQATKAAYLQHFVSLNQQVVIGTRNVESATLKSLSIQRQAAFETFVLFQPGEQGFRRALRRQVLNYEDRCREAVRQLA